MSTAKAKSGMAERRSTGPLTTDQREKAEMLKSRTRTRTKDEGCDEILTKEELAAKLKVALRTIENWQHDGFLPFLKISNVVLFHWPTVLAHLKANFGVSPRGAVRPDGKG